MRQDEKLTREEVRVDEHLANQAKTRLECYRLRGVAGMGAGC
jgi:hypothetical protein